MFRNTFSLCGHLAPLDVSRFHDEQQSLQLQTYIYSSERIHHRSSMVVVVAMDSDRQPFVATRRRSAVPIAIEEDATPAGPRGIKTSAIYWHDDELVLLQEVDGGQRSAQASQ